MTRIRHRIYTQSNGVGFQNFQPPTRGPCVNKDQSIRLWTTLILNKILGNLLLWALKQVVKVILKRRKKVHMSPHLNVISVSKISLYTQTAQAAVSCQYNILVIGCPNVYFFGLLRKFCNTFSCSFVYCCNIAFFIVEHKLQLTYIIFIWLKGTL